MNVQLNEDNAGDLLRTLDTTPSAPMSIDVTQAMRDGTRRRRVRKLATTSSAGAFALVLLASVPVILNRTANETADPGTSPLPSLSSPAPASAAPSASDPVVAKPPSSCVVQALPVPDNVAQALVSRADPTGRYIWGRSYPRNGNHQIIRWDDGKATKIPVTGDDPSVRGANTAGDAVATSFVDGRTVGWLIRGGQVTRLPGGTEATGINASGRISGNNGGQPVVWTSATAAPTALPLPAGADRGEAWAIDDDGTVVGRVYADTGERAYVWYPDGKHRALEGGLGAYTIRGGWATGIGDVGPNGTDSGLRWNVRTGKTDVAVGFGIRASTANASGWMVGTDAEGRGLFVAGSHKVVLPDLFLHRRGELTNIAETLSDDGRVIAGQADDKNSVIHAVVWRCT